MLFYYESLWERPWLLPNEPANKGKGFLYDIPDVLVDDLSLSTFHHITSCDDPYHRWTVMSLIKSLILWSWNLSLLLLLWETHLYLDQQTHVTAPPISYPLLKCLEVVSRLQEIVVTNPSWWKSMCHSSRMPLLPSLNTFPISILYDYLQAKIRWLVFNTNNTK